MAFVDVTVVRSQRMGLEYTLNPPGRPAKSEARG